VVVITGYGTEENEARASVLGASGFVRKPLTPEMIESVTLKALKEAEFTEAANETVAEIETAAETSVAAEPEKAAVVHSKAKKVARNVGLFFAAPFVALGYVIALPIVGFYQFVKLAREARAKKQLNK
jgi:FixJ family two-component response regulator